MFKDNPAALRAAADYLERHTANPTDPLDYCAEQLKRFHPRSVSRLASQALLDAERQKHEAASTPLARV